MSEDPGGTRKFEPKKIKMSDSDQRVINIAIWQPAPIPRVPTRRDFTGVTIAAIFTALLHALMFGAAVRWLGSDTSQGTSRAAQAGDISPAEALTLLPYSAPVVEDAESVRSVHSFDESTVRAPLLIRAQEAETSNAERRESQPYQSYLSQLRARVERAWRRPRSQISPAQKLSQVSFECDVQLEQTDSGVVLEVLIIQCNGTSVWQQSLLTAIQRASPLPVPSAPALFSPSIRLHFVGLPYAAGVAEEEYEKN